MFKNKHRNTTLIHAGKYCRSGVVIIALLTSAHAYAQQQNAQSAPVIDVIDPESFARGQKLFKKCQNCHVTNLDEENDRGPNLHGIFGASAGSRAGYEFSEAMKSSKLVWTQSTMDAFIRKPKALVPKTSMVYWGMRKEQDRADLIRYLKQVTQ